MASAIRDILGTLQKKLVNGCAIAESLSRYDFVSGKREYSKLNEPWLVKSCRYIEDNPGINEHPYLSVFICVH
jgi:hypothetical protein